MINGMISGNNSQHSKAFQELLDDKLCWWFHRATFEILTLIIRDHMEPFLGNLVGLEQLCPKVSQLFISYVMFTGMSINFEEDVQVFRQAKVIHNYLVEDKDRTSVIYSTS